METCQWTIFELGKVLNKNRWRNNVRADLFWPTSFLLWDVQTSLTHTVPLDCESTALYPVHKIDSSQAIKVSSGIYLWSEVFLLELLGYKDVSLVGGCIAQDVERFCVKNKVEQK